MPLKHDTETLLVFVLGFVTILAGMFASFLPPLSVSVVPWAILFILSIIYPFALYPLFRDRRADSAFRLLHFSPAAILFAWVMLELLAAAKPNFQYLQTWYTSSGSLLVVSVFLALLVVYCLRVIRQQFSRIGLILVLFLPFVAFSYASEQGEWDRRLTAALWDGGRTGTGFIAQGGSSSNLQPSSDPTEEEWRVELRRMEQRRAGLLQRESGSIVPPNVIGATSGTAIAAGGLKTLEGDTTPPRLPTSGFGAEGMAVVMIALCCALLHRKTIGRFMLRPEIAARASNDI